MSKKFQIMSYTENGFVPAIKEEPVVHEMADDIRLVLTAIDEMAWSSVPAAIHPALTRLRKRVGSVAALL